MQYTFSSFALLPLLMPYIDIETYVLLLMLKRLCAFCMCATRGHEIFANQNLRKDTFIILIALSLIVLLQFGVYQFISRFPHNIFAAINVYGNSDEMSGGLFEIVFKWQSHNFRFLIACCILALRRPLLLYQRHHKFTRQKN